MRGQDGHAPQAEGRARAEMQPSAEHEGPEPKRGEGCGKFDVPADTADRFAFPLSFRVGGVEPDQVGAADR